jgi:hypothetical protein
VRVAGGRFRFLATFAPDLSYDALHRGEVRVRQVGPALAEDADNLLAEFVPGVFGGRLRALAGRVGPKPVLQLP